MTVRMSDGKYYTAASPLTFSFANPNEMEALILVLKLSAPILGIIFMLFQPQQRIHLLYCFLVCRRQSRSRRRIKIQVYGAFLNHKDNYIVEFRQVSSNKFILGWEFWEFEVDGTQTITDHNLQFAPKSAQAFFANVIRNIDSTAGGGCDLY